MADGRRRDDIKVGTHVRVLERENFRSGKLTEGIVSRILTSAKEHPHGIMVELRNGAVGRVKEIFETGKEAGPFKEASGIADIDFDARSLEAFLAQGEGQMVEFKSSFRFDIKRFEATGVRERNKEVEKAISKTVASFMNTDGGYTFIGVNDDGKPIGIEGDLELMNKHNTDTFRLQLKNSLESYLLNKIIYEHLRIEFPVIHGKQVCVVYSTASPEPIFLNDAGKQECYVRVDNESKPFQYDEFLKYWQRRNARK